MFDSTVFVIEALSSSRSLNTLPKAIVTLASSSVAETSGKAFATTGGSSTSVTVTRKVSSTPTEFEVPVTVIVAVPFWSAW